MLGVKRQSTRQLQSLKDNVAGKIEAPKLNFDRGSPLSSNIEEALQPGIWSPGGRPEPLVPYNSPTDDYSLTKYCDSLRDMRLIPDENISDFNLPAAEIALPQTLPDPHRVSSAQATVSDNMVDSTLSNDSLDPPDSLMYELIDPTDSYISVNSEDMPDMDILPPSRSSSELSSSIKSSDEPQDMNITNATTLTSPTRESSSFSLEVDEEYFNRCHLTSTVKVPFPTLDSSATTSEFGFRPTLEHARFGIDMEDLRESDKF